MDVIYITLFLYIYPRDIYARLSDREFSNKGYASDVLMS